MVVGVIAVEKKNVNLLRDLPNELTGITGANLYPPGQPGAFEMFTGPASPALLTSYAHLSRSNKNIKIGRYARRKHTYTIRGRKEGTSILSVRYLGRDGRMLEIEQSIGIQPKR